MSQKPPPSNPSISAVITTLVPILAIAACGISAFLILREKQRRIYQPRTFLSSLRKQERTPTLSSGMFAWISEYFAMPDTYVLTHQSMDAYFLLRFLRIGTLICFVGCCITWPILWPVYATAGGGATQFDLLSLKNMTGNNDPRYYATTFVAWIFFGFVWYTVAREQVYFINLRQAYLLSPLYANRISSKTVLYSSVPLEYCDEAVIRELFKASPPKNVWVSTDCKELSEKVAERRSVINKLEGAESKLIKMANDNRLKALKKKNPQSVEEERAEAAIDINGESGSAAGRWVKPEKRPTHRLKPLIGKKVDTINWCREEIARLTPEVEALQDEHRNGSAKAVGSVFVEFNSQAEAQAAFQSTTHHHALHMAPRTVGVSPDDVIWSNLGIKWWQRLLRKLGTNTFVVLLLLFWALPVAAVGIISNLYNVLPGSCLPDGVGPSWMVWLCFITKLPKVLFGLIQGLLPSVLLAVLMALVPIVLRIMARIGGAPTKSAVELSTQSSYFAFQIIESFLVVTLGATASSAAARIGKSPGDTPTLLAQNIPPAANFYMSYVLVVAISFFWSSLLQIAGLVVFHLLGKFLDNTPRKVYNRWTSLGSLGWGSVFPMYEFLVCICIIFSCWSPLLLGWSAIGLYLIYQAFRYNLFFVYNCSIDTKGLVYPKALNHLTVGLYIAEVTTVGLLGLAEAIGPAILMAIFTVATILFHKSLNKALGPLIATLPTSLTVEEARLQRLENGNNSVSTEDGKVVKTDSTENGALSYQTSLPAPHEKPNFFTKWLRPDKYADYETMRRLVPHNFADVSYPAEIERNAFFDPSISDEPGIVWMPRDSMGISKQEIAHTSKVIDATDEDASFDDKGKIQWNKEHLPPIHQEKIYY